MSSRTDVNLSMADILPSKRWALLLVCDTGAWVDVCDADVLTVGVVERTTRTDAGQLSPQRLIRVRQLTN